MIIKCEIDVEWIGEDQNVDEVVQRKLIDKVAKNLSEQTIKSIQTEATKELFTQVHDRINLLLESFLDKPVFITDNYGDTKAKYASVSEMLKDRFDNFLTQKVDGSGKVSDSCSYNKYTRLEYFIEQIVQKKADAATTKIAQDIGKQVNEIIDKMMKDKISTVLVNKLDLKGVKDLKAQAANVHAAENLARLEAELSEKRQLHDAVTEYQKLMETAAAARAMVESCQAEAGFYDAMQKALAPAGIPTQMISEALAPVNELLAVAAGYLFPGRTLTLTPELDFALEGAPLLSKSAELRVGVAIQYVLAKLAGARLLMVDEVDMLDPANRKGFITFLRAVRPDFDTIMAFSTAASATPAPVDDVQVWAVNNGGVTAL